MNARRGAQPNVESWRRNWQAAQPRRCHTTYSQCSSNETSILTARETRRGEALAFVAEALDVFGAFLEGGDVAALDLFADLGDDIGIRERGDIAGVHLVGDGGEDAARDFAGARFGHVRDNVDGLGPGDFADHGFDGVDDFVLDGFGGWHAVLQ